jgi:hypothetical protein
MAKTSSSVSSRPNLDFHALANLGSVFCADLVMSSCREFIWRVGGRGGAKRSAKRDVGAGTGAGVDAAADALAAAESRGWGTLTGLAGAGALSFSKGAGAFWEGDLVGTDLTAGWGNSEGGFFLASTDFLVTLGADSKGFACVFTAGLDLDLDLGSGLIFSTGARAALPVAAGLLCSFGVFLLTQISSQRR